jgi:hypothetical protein
VAVEWTYGVNLTLSVATTTGRPVLAMQITVAAGSMRQVTVDYRDRTWWRATVPLPPGAQNPAPAGCGPGEVLGTQGWPAFIRYELTCGAFQADGRQRVDGIDAVKLTGSKGLVLWIDPATYLPVRQVVGGGQPPTDFHWRPATAASLAQMRLPVPAGFRQVPASPPTRTPRPTSTPATAADS